ncbi:ArsR/SmtB family transcription factor [Variovorax sp. JS1663]|uniref:ArsR/SmtB family transcription factor n=1 Tax=Variovorax sp. JS1663 TaxID=1851577 RepID=UPI000B3473C2|nr:helix-turn-helix transcriptional regulator [Variovorax sp. JS1663]OUM04061.1 transcriptional regulator [Variovorax sp. JS1663]
MNDKQVPLVEILVVLANEQRMEILRKLKSPRTSFPPQDEGDPVLDGVCVSSIQAGQGLAFSTTSKYLADLARIGLVTAKRSGKWSYYKRNEKAINNVLARLKAEL